MSEDKSQKQSDLEKKLVDTTPEQGRRRLLKKSVAIPVIMTLSSGAALARTSNLVGPITDLNEAVKDPEGNLYCVLPDIHDPLRDDESIDPVDLGSNPTVTVNPIQDESGNPDLQAQANACFTTPSGGGILVSSNAWISVGPKVGITNI